MAEQYSWISANNEGYSAGNFSAIDGNIRPWTRSTVADGKWLNREMLLPFSGRDQYLLDSLNQTYDECSAFSGDLQNQITIIEARSDVIDVVGSHDAFTARSAELVSGVDISDRDVIKILNDDGTDIPVWIYNTETNRYVESTVSPSNQQTYYRWLSAVNDGPSGWEYVGDLEPYYKDVELTENSITFKNTAPERDYAINTDLNRFIQMTTAGNTGTIGITDDFISSASQVYNALSSISGINEGTLEGARVDHKVSNYSLAQGSACSASDNSFAQGKFNSAKSNSFAQGQQVSAKNRGMAQGNNANANENSFAQGYNVTATTAAFAQGSTVKSNYYSISQGLNTFADNYSISQGTNTSAQYYSIAQGNATSADDYSQSFGRGTKMLHSGMAIGTYNKSDNIPFVIGNGTSDNNRSDLFLINRNGDVSAKGDISAKNFYINGNPIDSIVSARFSAYNGDTKLAELPISAFKLQANTAKYISATSAANTMIFNVSDALINSASSGYQAKQWINTNGDGIIGSAKSGAAASAWITGNSGNYIPWTAINGAVGHDNQLPSSPGDTPWMYFGDANTGGTWNSYAFGTKNFAGSNSLAAGNSNYASNQSLALGTFCRAEDDSIAVGANNTAKYHSQAFGHGTHIEGHSLGSTPYYLGGLAIGNYNKTTADVTFVIGNGHDGNDRSDLFFITTAGLVSAITVDTPKLSAENVTVYYTSMGNKKASVTIDGIQGFNQYIHEGGQASDLWSSGALRQNNLTLAYHETNVDPMTEIVKINQSKVQYSSSNLTAPITASWPDILNGSLNAGNYVSAGDNQKLTMMSADNTTFTIAGMSPNIIYIV